MTTKNFIKVIKFSLILFYSFLLESSFNSAQIVEKNISKQKIMIALLLDTSNSMDGLINQAKSQLWTIVNELSLARDSKGRNPDIYIALFEYGNTNLPSSEGYIRMVTPLTSDLDQISEDLFDLTTNGGDEFCGQVIKRSVDQLDWSNSDSDLKIIFIAGNEPFTQGNVSYQSACSLAKKKDIVVNSIYCGDYDEGISSSWKTGALMTGGAYMSIEQNKKTVFIKTPYDQEINKLNDALNDTYVYYGKEGYLKQQRQQDQDSRAFSLSASNKAKRAIFKSSARYKNSSWDLADAYKDGKVAISEVQDDYLPEKMRGMTPEQKKEYINKKLEQRKQLQKKIQKLALKRKSFILNKQKAEVGEKTLDSAMLKPIRDLARSKNLKFDNY